MSLFKAFMSFNYIHGSSESPYRNILEKFRSHHLAVILIKINYHWRNQREITVDDEGRYGNQEINRDSEKELTQQPGRLVL